MEEEKLIRDFDILGIQKEVDLIFMTGERERAIPNSIIDREYNSCLKYNDSNKNKIIKAEITYGNRFGGIADIGGSNCDSGDSFSVNKIVLMFSNRSSLSLSYNKGFCSFVIDFKGSDGTFGDNPLVNYYNPGKEILAYLKKDAIRSTIDSYLFVFREMDKDKELEKVLLENDIL